jgi:aminoglycoside phosphotransferase (APT) family kinase protein
MGLAEAGDAMRFEPLAGGVSSDIWLVEIGSRRLCIKRALARLKVAAEWRAPVERSRYEVGWMRFAASVAPDAVPAVLGEDMAAGLFAMPYLEPVQHPLWKTMLRDGVADQATAESVADRLVSIHAASAGRPELSARFATDAIFHAIRLEPYLLATARAHPDRAQALQALATVTANNKKALVHGDVSPKNILIGPNGPIFLDAECAWWGDPAFDLAFCVNHLLLKCLWNRPAARRFLDCFAALAERYFAGVDWEERATLEERAARLLPGLFLARVDGKSPVEYLTEAADKDRVRRFARAFLADPARRLGEIQLSWAREIGA